MSRATPGRITCSSEAHRPVRHSQVPPPELTYVRVRARGALGTAPGAPSEQLAKDDVELP